MKDTHSEPSGANPVRVLGRREVLLARGRRDERIAAIAAAQRGRVARWQLLLAGIGRSAIQRMVENGRLYRLHPGVYAVGHPARSELCRETEALLACRWGAVLSHHSAAALWRIRRANDQEPVDVLVVGGQATKKHDIRSRRTTHLHPQQIRIRHGLPLTSPARTLIDIATDLRPRELEWALDEALATHIISKSQLAEALERSQSRPGAAILRTLAEQRTTLTRTRSHPEETLLRLLREADIKLPLVNVQLYGFEADFYWPNERLVVEVDGYQWHSSRSAFERDHRKDVTFRAHGLEVDRFSAEQIEGRPYVVVAAVAGRLAALSS